MSSNTTIEDCAFIGSITGDNGDVSNIAGLVAWGDAGTTTISNSYVNATYTKVSGLNPILRHHTGTISHVYYSEKSKGINPDYNKKGNLGEQVTAEQLRNGEVAYLLQNKRTENVWGQNLGSDDEPLLTADGAKRVCKVEFAYNNSVRATRYATRNKHIYGSLPTVQEILGTGYNPQHYYSGLTFADNFSGSTSVTADKQVAVRFTHKNVCEIASKADWKEFCDLVNGGQTKLNAKMTANVDLGSDIAMVGNGDHKYSGTFDGQGHTLTVNWNNSADLAPFYCVNSATIKNLHVKGKIISNDFNLSGLIMYAFGKNSVSGCVIDMNLKGSQYIAGMICWTQPYSQVTITDCVVKGAFNSATERIGGFVDNPSGSCTFTNCLYAGTNNAPIGSNTFADNATVTNCYYLNACGVAQGTKITAEQLKSGEVTKKLQNNRTDKCYWAQQLGEMPDFYNAADKSKANYVYYDAAKKGWTCDDFRLTDGQPLPIGLDFTAANVTYERKFNGTQKATLCLPYDLSAQGFKAYTFSGGNKNEVHFKEVDDKLTAYTPYYITADGTPQLGGTNIEVKAYKADKMKQSAGVFTFIGTVDGMSNENAAAANAYILQDDGKFHKVTTVNSATTIPAYHAYITYNGSNGAKLLSVVLNGETTSIGDVTNDNADMNAPVYDLQGRYIGTSLNSLPAGVYIGGGKKIMKK